MTDEQQEQLKAVLAKGNHHLTQARLKTFELLVHPEPQSIREILSKNNGDIDRVTIYRNIDLFEKLGIVHRLYVGWKFKLELSDQFIPHHHHLSCLQCQKIIDIEGEQSIDEFIKKVSAQFNFLPQQHHFEVSGYCHDCQAKEGST